VSQKKLCKAEDKDLESVHSEWNFHEKKAATLANGPMVKAKTNACLKIQNLQCFKERV
jgi:hypothetical protein